MKRLGSGEVPRTTWDDEFFLWWGEQVITIEDYPYPGMELMGDTNLPLPPRVAWGVIGKITFKLFLII